jgi:hypothetical protein
VNRKQVLSIFAVMFMATTLGLLILSVSPIWLAVLMIRPTVIKPLSDFVIKRVMQQMMGMMFGGNKRIPAMKVAKLP